MNDYLYEVAKRLVAFDTVSAKSDRDAMEYLAAELAPRGFKTAIQPIELFGVAQANLVAWVGPPRADGLIISGHVDTVPFDGQPGWEREPLKLELAGERNLRPRHHRHERLHRAMPRRGAHARFSRGSSARWYSSSPRARKSDASALIASRPRSSKSWAKLQCRSWRGSASRLRGKCRTRTRASCRSALPSAASAATAARRPAASTRSP